MRPLTFEHKGNTYILDFLRSRKDVPLREDYDGKRPLGAGAQTTHPDTTVIIWMEREGHPEGHEMYRTATAGCYHTDRFRLEEGRIKALRSVSKTLSKEMRAKVWECYTKRPTGTPACTYDQDGWCKRNGCPFIGRHVEKRAIGPAVVEGSVVPPQAC